MMQARLRGVRSAGSGISGNGTIRKRAVKGETQNYNKK
jgi:hypothetical protein